jgi:C1A family cysteine protease
MVESLDNRDLTTLKSCLALALPFAFGFDVYESFESRSVAVSGILPTPKAGERQLGGHAVLAVGYSDARQAFIVRNSWGAGWGQEGYFWFPYKLMTNTDFASDFWTARKAS